MTENFATLGTVLFALAVLHTFSIKRFQHQAKKYPEGSVAENLFHLLGEVEIVFAFWAAILVLALRFLTNQHETVFFLESLNFTEPLFVFVIMAMAATKPVIELATYFIDKIAHWLPLPQSLKFYFASLFIGPLLGSFITEPAAMTVTALVLKERYFDKAIGSTAKYLTLATLFVNVSIGGVLTHFAAPPVLMVASQWSWDSAYMFDHFGWKAVLAVLINAFVAAFVLGKQLSKIEVASKNVLSTPSWIYVSHVLFLTGVVLNSHHSILFIGLFLLFLGFAMITKEYQSELKLKESLLVASFLGGLVILGAFQSWWLKPLLQSLTTFPLFAGSAILTAFVDNAALTYLGAQVQGLSEEMKYALVAGAVTGGGLTVIANAPNPAGFTILQTSFGKEGISPMKLFLFATVPTLIAAAAFWCL